MKNMQSNETLALEVRDLKKYFPIKKGVTQHTVGHVRAVDGVSFSIPHGKTFGLVGESGCGKTTIGRTILRLIDPTEGSAIIDGVDVFKLKKKQLRKIRPKFQMIFQDPFSSLDPRMSVGAIIGEAVREHNIVPRSEHNAYILKVMKQCGLRSFQVDRYPHEFSGGQRQRICIARALALNPQLIIADEPVSALDVSIQAQVINLMKDLQEELGISYLFISHDLSVVEYISDYVGVMYLGSLVEMGSKKALFKEPLHPYTRALLSAVPVPNPEVKMNRIILEGDVPSPANPPSGCKFHTRCRQCMEVCKNFEPKENWVSEDHYVKCHLYDANIAETADAALDTKSE